jgi:hypothetical protein
MAMSITKNNWSSLLRRERRSFLLVFLALILVSFALSPMARAVTPAPDGGYPNGNTAEGDNALFTLKTGIYNTATGFNALYYNDRKVSSADIDNASYNTATGAFALFINQLGHHNTACGADALRNNQFDNYNTAMGSGALFNNHGPYNTATGFNALYNNFGHDNTATGAFALASNAGEHNTATGFEALRNNRGSGNTATGAGALFNNAAYSNTATGSGALFGNTSGKVNTASGFRALYSNTTGFNNAATGANSLFFNTTGTGNTANGYQALSNNATGKGNTADGNSALFNNTGSFNTAVGLSAGNDLTTGSNNIDIGNRGIAGESNTIRVGAAGKSTATYIAGIRGTATVNADVVPVVIDSAGQLGTISSSRRFKDQIKPMDNSSAAILALEPVTFHYKSDTQNTPQFGLIAEEVTKVNPDLVVRDETGEIYTVRYEAVNAMLLNEFLKEHRKVEEQDRRLQRQETAIAQQQKQIEALTATVQKVSDQVALSKPAPQLVANP